MSIKKVILNIMIKDKSNTMDTFEVVIHVPYGTFSLTEQAMTRFNELRVAHHQSPVRSCHRIDRHDPLLIQTVKEFQYTHPRLEIRHVPIVYKDTYEISTEAKGADHIICDPLASVGYSIKHKDFDGMNEQEIRDYLQNLKMFLQNPPDLSCTRWRPTEFSKGS